MRHESRHEGEVYKLIDLSVSIVDKSFRDTNDLLSNSLKDSTVHLQRQAGTPHYMSPESIKTDEIVTYQTDLWSLGVVIFRALSGTLPFANGPSVHF